jgi:hypothetical protein
VRARPSNARLAAKGGNWTIDDLNQFIANPRAFVPGTNMTFVGIPRDGERADIIVYLNSLSAISLRCPTAQDHCRKQPKLPARLRRGEIAGRLI